MTDELFRNDSYLKSCTATVTGIDERGIQTDRSVFYPLGGGQPGDTGTLVLPNGEEVLISDTRKDRPNGEHLHIVEQSQALALHRGDKVALVLDWQRRHRLMRFHSALHMLCAVIDAPVTSGSIQTDRARLDFDLAEPVDKQQIGAELNALIARDVPMLQRYITQAELDAQPQLVRTLSVQPPRNAAGTVRLVEFAGIDLQPCGGTHVASSGEIGPVVVRKVEKKGRINRRIIIAFDE